MNTFIFDLDGTLLPMPNQDLFVQTYFKALATKMAPYGYEPQALIKAVWAGTKAMIENDGSITNEQQFWKTFNQAFGKDILNMEPVFEEFYNCEFNSVKEVTSTDPLAKECIELLKEKGYRRILATNPIFPQIATINRIKWAGLDPDDFELITTYENSSFCKPNLDYYKEIIISKGLNPEECIMIGNDVKEDMCTENLGMNTFLLENCLINIEDVDISNYNKGNFEDLLRMIKELPYIN